MPAAVDLRMCFHAQALLALPFPPSRASGVARDEPPFASRERIGAGFSALQSTEPAERSRVRILSRLTSSHAA